MRIVLAVVVFLFGATFWWMSSFMTGQAVVPRHWSWTLTNALVVLSILGYIITAWAILRTHSWWEVSAVVSGVLGLLAVGVFLVAQQTLEIGFQDLGVQLNLWMHLVGSVAVLVLAGVPALRNCSVTGSIVSSIMALIRQRPLMAPQVSYFRAC